MTLAPNASWLFGVPVVEQPDTDGHDVVCTYVLVKLPKRKTPVAKHSPDGTLFVPIGTCALGVGVPSKLHVFGIDERPGQTLYVVWPSI